MLALRIAARDSTRSLRLATTRRRFADVPAPVRKQVTVEERAALRKARRERLQKEATAEGEAPAATAQISAARVRWVWYASVILPAGLFAWAYNDENSPPAKFAAMIGLTGFITSYTDELSKPAHEKLLPDWNQVSRR